MNASDSAEYDTSGTAVGNHSFTANYNGDASFNASKGGPVAFTIAQAATATSILSAPATALATDNIGMTIDIGTQSYGVGPMGTVTLYAGTTQIGSTQVQSSAGSAMARLFASSSTAFGIPVTATTLLPGPNSITAAYSGDTNYAASTSSAITITITPAFSLSASTATPSAIAPGGSTSATITVTPTTGFSGTVSFVCSVAGNNGLDQHLPICSAPSVTIAPGSTAPATTIATVTTTPSTTAALRHTNQPPKKMDLWSKAGGGALLACLVLFGVPARRHSWRSMLGIFAILAVLSIAGCGGGGGSGPTTQPGTSADSYQVKVTAHDSTGKVSSFMGFSFSVN